MNETQIIDIWVLMTDYVESKDLRDAAERYVELLVDHGVNTRVLSHVSSNDSVLDQAIEDYLEAEQIEEDYEELGFE